MSTPSPADLRIGTLEHVPFTGLVDTIVRAFEGYFVPIPHEHAYWQDRFHCAGVDLSRSYGAFHGDTLTAFIIQAFGTIDGNPTAYNSGTGVLPAYRGRQFVDALYAHAIPLLMQDGIARCTLEVIDRNAVALRVYERIGFRVEHRWKSFKGTLSAPVGAEAGVLVPTDIRNAGPGDDGYSSWDHRLSALMRSQGRQQWYTLNGDVHQGHVVMDPEKGRVARLSVADESDVRQWQRLLSALTAVKRDVLFVNVHPERTALIQALLSAGLENHIDQFGMRLDLPVH